MYEDSQRFSDDERDDGNTARANPRSTQFVSRETNTQMSEPSFIAASDVITPEMRGQIPPDISYYGKSKSLTGFEQTQSGRALSHERDKSMDRIVRRMSPSTRDRYLRYIDDDDDLIIAPPIEFSDAGSDKDEHREHGQLFETRSEAGSFDYEPITEPTKILQMDENVVETVKLDSGPSYHLITEPRVHANPIGQMPSHSLPRKMSIQLVHGATETAQNKATGISTTYSKLLPGVETFSLPHMSPESKLNMKYPERTGVGYRVDREDGTYSYQYFEPIPSSQRHFQTIKETKGGNLLTGHGTASDQGHADPLLGGGTGSLSFPRNQRENTHPTGTPKFCGDAGAARGTFSLNRGADFLHAPARPPATVHTFYT